jgi:hypothetical protein
MLLVSAVPFRAVTVLCWDMFNVTSWSTYRHRGIYDLDMVVVTFMHASIKNGKHLVLSRKPKSEVNRHQPGFSIATSHLHKS